MDGDPAALAMNPLIAEHTSDTLYSVACVLEALQSLPAQELTARGRLGMHLVLDTARRALLSEVERGLAFSSNTE